MARPGQTKLNTEPWWRSAVFYRIVPENFQDSDGDGIGDLAGVAQRLDYLQSLNVDAIVLHTPFNDAGFDDLVSAASRRHIRVLVELPDSDGDAILPKARQWLTRGAAGIWFQIKSGETADRTAALVHGLRSLTDSIPGQRILVEDTSADPAIVPAAGAQLVTRVLPADFGAGASAMRLALTQAQNVPQGSIPLMLAVSAGASGSSSNAHQTLLDRVLAMALLVSRGAVALTYGQEIGLPSAGAANGTIMWWTPKNVTKPPDPPEPPEVSKAATPQREDVYGAYVPYVPPKPKKPANSKPDLNELPGFTNGALPAAVAGASSVNVAVEDGEKDSLLNLYRKLSQFHHGDPAVHAGTEFVLEHDAQNVMIWGLREPAGSRTVTAVIAACNLSDQRANFSLHADVERLKLRGGPLRVVITTSPSNIQADQLTDAATLAPWSMMLAFLDR